MKGQQINDSYICSKHNEKIQMIVMDKQVIPQERMLCYQCFHQKQQMSTNIISIKQALDLISEKHQLISTKYSEDCQQLINNINNFQQKMNSLKSQIHQCFENMILQLSESVKIIKKLQIQNQNPPSLQVQLQQQDFKKLETKDDPRIIIKPFILKMEAQTQNIINTIQGIQQNQNEIKNELIIQDEMRVKQFIQEVQPPPRQYNQNVKRNQRMQRALFDDSD